MIQYLKETNKYGSMEEILAELSNLLDKIWDNRKFINNTDLETLKHLSNKGI
jgi:hypothetical protein